MPADVPMVTRKPFKRRDPRDESLFDLFSVTEPLLMLEYIGVCVIRS